MSAPLLLIGELIVDFTLMPIGTENKLRLGGIAHAARGLWSIGKPFAVAAVFPKYLQDSAQKYLESLGCAEFIELGDVVGAPNVMIVGDPIEVGDQGYENLLRDEKEVRLNDVSASLSRYQDFLVFPGAYNLNQVCQMLPEAARLHLDIAYDVESTDVLLQLTPTIETILISTSSELFLQLGSSGIKALKDNLRPLSPATIILKENRGGARIVDANGEIQNIPALLGITANSVGVGDAFSAAFVAFLKEGSLAAGLKAARVSSAYAQTTYPDLFQTYVERSLKLSVGQMADLSGTLLPWEDRKNYPIYLAAPDFSYVDRCAIDEALRSLNYHNFDIRRPVQENGELPKDAGTSTLRETYQKDVDLLRQCKLVFAVPTDRDPGTLVEIGLAIQMNIPVIVFDPRGECRNTMVIAGSDCYSQSLDECLNAVFTIFSGLGRPNV